MEIQLLVSDESPPCEQARSVWTAVCAMEGFELHIVNIHRREGEAIAKRLRLSSVPALVINGNLVAVGVQTAEQAQTILRDTL